MLKKELNEELTQVGKGTPGGELLRRYWQPFALAGDVDDENSIKKIKVLDEELILIKKDDGGFALMGEKCPHRGASLSYAFQEADSIRCCYHGWEFDFDGVCIDKPFEKKNKPTKLLPSYPVVERCGILFTYMGPEEDEPVFPEWDMLHRTDGSYKIEVQDDHQCNWLQIQENAADVTHTFFLHAKYLEAIGANDNTGFNLPMKKYGFQPFDWGIVKSWEYEGDDKEGWGNLLVFPNILRLMTETHWRVPIDDTTTRIFWLTFVPGEECKPGEAPEIEVVKQPKRQDEDGKYKMNDFMSQDAMATETQGPVYDRTKERLGASDKGVVMFRKMLRDQIEAVKNGDRPIANQYDKDQAGKIIDLRDWMGGYIPMSCAEDPEFVQKKTKEETFDERHSEYELPESSKKALSKKYKTGMKFEP